MKDCGCCSEVCVSPDILKAENKLRVFSSIKGEDKLSAMQYGYHCEECIDKELEKATLFEKAIEDIKKAQVLGKGSSCLCDKDIQNLIEKVNKLTEFCGDVEDPIKVDRSNREKFIFNNPQCVKYENWERFSKRACSTIGFNLSVTKDICDITFQLSNNIISCDLLYAIKVRKEVCDLGMSIKKSISQCRVDYELLMEKHDCDLTYKKYAKLVSCNIGYSLVNEALKCGLGFIIKGKTPYLKTPMGKYKLDDLCPLDLTMLNELGKEIKINKRDITVDYE